MNGLEKYIDSAVDSTVLKEHLGKMPRDELEAQAFALAALLKAHKLRHEGMLDRLHRDPVTGVLNRLGLEDRHNSWSKLARRNGDTAKSNSVMIIDLDGFKAVNDTHGHAEGDKVLRRSAEIFEFSVRNDDLVGRSGGDEFTILLHDATPDEGLVVVDRISERRQALISEDPAFMVPTFSVGIAAINHTVSFEEMYSPADMAMYVAKRNGGNQAQIFKAA